MTIVEIARQWFVWVLDGVSAGRRTHAHCRDGVNGSRSCTFFVFA